MPTVAAKKKASLKKPRTSTRSRMVHLVKDPLTGLMVTPARPGRKPITSEDVARASAEYP